MLSLTVQCVPQVKMGRSRGVGMPRAKKKKVEPHKEAGPSEAEPAPAAGMPPPPPRSPEPSRRPALPQSPARKAAQEANLVLREALKKQKAAGKWLRRADTLMMRVGEMRSEVHIKVEKALKNKAQAKKNAFKINSMYDKAERLWHEELFHYYAAKFEFAEAERDVSRAQGVCKDLQIARLLGRIKKLRS